MINLALKKIDEKTIDDNRIAVMHFEPWNFVSADQLIQQFFVQMKDAFRQKDFGKNLEDLADALELYGSLLSVAIGTTGIGLPIAFAGNVAFRSLGRRIKSAANTDLTEQKHKIEQLLKKKEQKILIVIDDIDRLNNQEIKLIFQLVASLAHFANTVYLLSFDRDIVVKALKDVQTGDGNEYLEKIIQMPIRIPEPQGSDLQNIIIERFEALLKEFPAVNLDRSSSGSIFMHCVSPFIQTVRDINRLHNALQFKLSAISTEIDFTDLAAITAMELTYPQVFEWIQGNKPLLTGEYDLQHEENDPTETEITKKKYEDIISNRIPKDSKKPDKTIEIILKSIGTMFPYFGFEKVKIYYGDKDKGKLKKGKHIGTADCFDRYFDLDPNRIVLKRDELQDILLKNTEEENISIIRQKIENHGLDPLLAEIQINHNEIPKSRVPIVIKSIADTFKEIIEADSQALFRFNAFRTVNLVMDLFEDINIEQRKNVLLDLLSNANTGNLSLYASIINSQYPLKTEQKAEPPGKNKVFLLPEDREDIWTAFTERTKKLIEENIVFDFTYWAFISRLLSSLDQQYTTTYFQDILKTTINILRFLSQFVSEGHSSQCGAIYQVDSIENPYISSEQIIESVETAKASGDIEKVSDEERLKAMAVYLFIKNGQEEREFPVSKIEELFIEQIEFTDER